MIDRAVRALIDGAFDKASAILKDRRAMLEAGARALLEHETLSQDDLKSLLETGAIKALKTAAASA